MTIPARSTALPANFGFMHPLRWVTGLTALAVVAMPNAAAAAKVRAAAVPGGYDGNWNVLIITEAGACDRAASFPVTISGGRVLGSGGADVSGRVGRGGGVSVRVSAGGSSASGSGRLAASAGAGRWSGKGSAGVCSGRWQATRS